MTRCHLSYMFFSETCLVKKFIGVLAHTSFFTSWMYRCEVKRLGQKVNAKFFIVDPYVSFWSLFKSPDLKMRCQGEHFFIGLLAHNYKQKHIPKRICLAFESVRTALSVNPMTSSLNQNLICRINGIAISPISPVISLGSHC